MIYINDIPSFRAPESFGFTFDDRIENIELINGNVAQNYGHIESGDKFFLKCVFARANYELIKSLWTSDTRVSFTDEDGTVYHNLRLVFRNYDRIPKFPNYAILTFELWRV